MSVLIQINGPPGIGKSTIAQMYVDRHLGVLNLDVVMPQFIGRIDELAHFEAVAIEAGGRFCEVVLMDTKQRSVDRFSSRGGDDGDVWHQQVKDIVGDSGGNDCCVQCMTNWPRSCRHVPMPW